MIVLLTTVVAKSPRCQALEKFSQAISAGGENAPVPITVELLFIAVKMIKTNGAIQITAMTTSVIHSATSSGSMRSVPAWRKGLAIALIDAPPAASASSAGRG